MRSHAIRARPPRGDAGPILIRRDLDVIAAHLEDAAHFPGGHASGLTAPASEAEVAAIVAGSETVLPIGAQSSLTGGATPMGGVLLSTTRLNRGLRIEHDRAHVGAGVSIADLDGALARVGKYYPPAPTFAGAFVGGTIATNAAGAATFKYGTTREWVEALTVVLASGDVLDLQRGDVVADEGGRFEIELRDRTVQIAIPRYRMPDVPKLSAGYFARPGMDLIDLFIGSEGTLGVITEATLRIVPRRPTVCLAFVPLPSRAAALELVGYLRREAQRTWHQQDPGGLDVSAIEHMDARCLQILREDGADRQYGVTIPSTAAIALLVALELAPGTTAADAYDEIGRIRDGDAPGTPLVRFCRVLDDAGALDDVQIAVPGDAGRAAQLIALREAVPEAVNARVGRAKQHVDQRIAKTAADMIVPFEALGDLLELYDREFAARGLDAAVWGHISDGNLHPNVIPRSFADVEAGREAIRTFGREVIRMGGSPLAEHGVGRNRLKQQLLADLYGSDAIDQMRAVKRALDPEWKLAPGVIFERAPAV